MFIHFGIQVLQALNLISAAYACCMSNARCSVDDDTSSIIQEICGLKCHSNYCSGSNEKCHVDHNTSISSAPFCDWIGIGYYGNK